MKSSDSVAENVDAFVTSMVEANMRAGVPMTVESVMSRILQKFFPTTSASSIPVAIKQLPALSRLVALQGRVTAKIVAAVSTRPIVTLYELQEEIVMSEGVSCFKDLGLGASILALEVCKTFFNSFFGSTGDSGGDVQRMVRVVEEGPAPIRTSDFVGWLLSCDSAQSLLSSSDTIVLIEAFVRDYNRYLAAAKGHPRITNTRLTGIHIENVTWLVHLVREAAGSFNARFQQELVAVTSRYQSASPAPVVLPTPKVSRMYPLAEASVRAPITLAASQATPVSVATSSGDAAISIDLDFGDVDGSVNADLPTINLFAEAWSSSILCDFVAHWGTGMSQSDAAFLHQYCHLPVSHTHPTVDDALSVMSNKDQIVNVVKYALTLLEGQSDSHEALILSKFIVATWLMLHQADESVWQEVASALRSVPWVPILHKLSVGGIWVEFVRPGQVLDSSPSVGRLFDQFKKTSAVCLKELNGDGITIVSRPAVSIPTPSELGSTIGFTTSTLTWSKDFLSTAGVIVDATGKRALQAIGFLCGLDTAASVSSLRLPVALVSGNTSTEVAQAIVNTYNSVSERWASTNASGEPVESGIRYLFVPSQSASSVVGWFVPIESVFLGWAKPSHDGVGYGEYLLPIAQGPLARMCVSMVPTHTTLSQDSLIMCLPGAETLYDETIAGEVDLQDITRSGLQCSAASWITTIRAFRTMRALEQRKSISATEGEQVSSLTELIWGAVAYRDGGWSDDLEATLFRDEPLVFIPSHRAFRSLNSRIYFTDAIVGCNPRQFRAEDEGDVASAVNNLNLVQLATIGRRCPDVYIRSLLTALGIHDVYDGEIDVVYTSISNVPSAQIHTRINNTLPYIQSALMTAEFVRAGHDGSSLMPGTYWNNVVGGPASTVQRLLTKLSVVVCSTPFATVRLCDASGKRFYKRWPIKVHFSPTTSTIYLSETDCSAFIVAEGLTEVLVSRHLHFEKVHNFVRSQCRSLIGRPPMGRPYSPLSQVFPPQWVASEAPMEKPRVVYPPGHGASDQRILTDTVMPSYRATPEMSGGIVATPIVDRVGADTANARLPDSFLRIEPVYLSRFEGEVWEDIESEAAALVGEARNAAKRTREELGEDEVQFGQHEAVADFCSNGGVGALGSRSGVVSSMKGDYQVESENYSRSAERYATRWLREKYGGTFVWVNESKESGTPYDILHVQYQSNSPSALPRVQGYYEVKCTSTKGRRAFEISLRELLLAAKYGDNYTILRVYNAFDDSASQKDGSLRHNVRGMEVEEFRNPIKLWKQRRLVLSGGINAVAM